MRFHLALEIGVILDNARNDELHSGLLRDLDALFGSFLMVNAAEEEKIIAGIGLKSKPTDVNSMINCDLILAPNYG